MTHRRPFKAGKGKNSNKPPDKPPILPPAAQKENDGALLIL